MSRAHNAKGTIKEIAAIISSIADGALLNPHSSEHARELVIMKLGVERARSHYDLTAAAVRGSYWCAKYDDMTTADLIVDLMGVGK
jgi:hypothetical protein